MGRARRHHADLHALLEDAVLDAHEQDDAEVRVVPRVHQQQRERCIRVALGRRQLLDQRLEHVGDACAGFGRNEHGLGRIEADDFFDLCLGCRFLCSLGRGRGQPGGAGQRVPALSGPARPRLHQQRGVGAPRGGHAGFAQSDIEITLDGNKLTISGKTTDDAEGGEFLFKGIANRAFTRTFALADKIEVQSAEIVNGMLKVALDKLAEVSTVKKIEVKGAKKSKKEFLAEEAAE